MISNVKNFSRASLLFSFNIFFNSDERLDKMNEKVRGISL